MFSAEHASSTGPAVMEEGRRRRGGNRYRLVHNAA